MKNSTIITEINKINELTSAIVYSLESFTSAAKQVDYIHAAYLETLASPADFKPVLFASAVAPIACQWFDEKREAMADYLGEGASWTDHEDFASVQSGFTSFVQKLARVNSFITFKVKNKTSVAKFLEGQRAEWCIHDKGYSAKADKKVSATGKASSASADGATVATPTEGATMLETMTGDVHMAEAAILQALKAYPGLTLKKSIIQAFQTADTTARTASAARKVKNEKAKKAA